MPNEIVRLSRGFLLGALVGAALIAYGMTGYGVAVLLGIERDKSGHGISLLPIYVLSFAVAGGEIAMLRHKSNFHVRTIAAMLLAIVIVFVGIGFMTSFIIAEEPVESWMGIWSVTVLIVMLAGAFAIHRRYPASNPPSVSPP
jgi:hypothetical protein